MLGPLSAEAHDLDARSTSVCARRRSGSALVAVTRSVPYPTSPLAAVSSRRCFSVPAASGRVARACRSTFAAGVWSLPLPLLVAPVSAVKIASLALMPAWIASPAAGVSQESLRFGHRHHRRSRHADGLIEPCHARPQLDSTRHRNVSLM